MAQSLYCAMCNVVLRIVYVVRRSLMEFAWTSPDRLVMLAYGLNVRAIAKVGAVKASAIALLSYTLINLTSRFSSAFPSDPTGCVGRKCSMFQ